MHGAINEVNIFLSKMNVFLMYKYANIDTLYTALHAVVMKGAVYIQMITLFQNQTYKSGVRSHTLERHDVQCSP